ncbi:MAG: hypothetical protein JNL67_17540 [Planctomycetaceae bacterium]|nr:hypothetical protein [Planctomycetaceae bacterium]
MAIQCGPKSPDESLLERRVVLGIAAGLLLGGIGMDRVTAQDLVQESKHVGKPGDFDFLAGEWKIHNRRKKPEANEWDEFASEATCWTVLGGIGSIEELRIPARDFSGIGVRLLDVQQKIWSDHWVNGKSGVLTTPGQTGVFVDGVGTFTSDWSEGDQKMLVKGVWDQITPNSCRWYQAVSKDAGATWEENWIMQWSRVK